MTDAGKILTLALCLIATDVGAQTKCTSLDCPYTFFAGGFSPLHCPKGAETLVRYPSGGSEYSSVKAVCAIVVPEVSPHCDPGYTLTLDNQCARDLKPAEWK